MSQSYETLLVERRGRVALITINRPEKRNALNIKTRQEGAAAFDELREDESCRVVVVTGAGEKAFVAGADIAEFEGRTPVTQRDVMTSRSLFTAVDTFTKPVIAMVNGYCLGGGCELALSCDLRIASETARFGQPEINLGIIPGGGGTQRLTRLVGDPGDEEAEPVVGRLDDLDADARRAVDGRRDAYHHCGDFDRRAVGAVRAQVKALAAFDFLIEVEERAAGRNVVRLRRLTPRCSVFGAPRNDDGQAERHPQGKALLLTVWQGERIKKLSLTLCSNYNLL